MRHNAPQDDAPMHVVTTSTPLGRASTSRCLCLLLQAAWHTVVFVSCVARLKASARLQGVMTSKEKSTRDDSCTFREIGRALSAHHQASPPSLHVSLRISMVSRSNTGHDSPFSQSSLQTPSHIQQQHFFFPTFPFSCHTKAANLQPCSTLASTMFIVCIPPASCIA